MSGATPTISPREVPEEDLLRLVALGKRSGALTMDQVVHILRSVELTAEVIEADIPSGAPDNVVRTVMENSRTLKFTTHGFETH